MSVHRRLDRSHLQACVTQAACRRASGLRSILDLGSSIIIAISNARTAVWTDTYNDVDDMDSLASAFSVAWWTGDESVLTVSGGTDRVLTGFELCGRATGRPGRHLRTGIALAVRVCIPRPKHPFSSFPRTTRLRRAPQPALLTTSRALRASHWATRDPSRQPRPKQAPPKSPK